MSDEQAEKAEADKKAQEEAQAKAQEELNNRLKIVQLVYDKETGQFARIPNENVTKQVELDGMLFSAIKNELVSSFMRALRAELDQREAGKKKGLFGAR